MSSIWLYGTLAFWIYRVFNAGMNSKKLFYRAPRKYLNDDLSQYVFSGKKAVNYITISFGIGLFWFLCLPAYGVFKLGQRFNKEA